jgi:hypothetical protein
VCVCVLCVLCVCVYVYVCVYARVRVVCVCVCVSLAIYLPLLMRCVCVYVYVRDVSLGWALSRGHAPPSTSSAEGGLLLSGQVNHRNRMESGSNNVVPGVCRVATSKPRRMFHDGAPRERER